MEGDLDPMEVERELHDERQALQGRILGREEIRHRRAGGPLQVAALTEEQRREVHKMPTKTEAVEAPADITALRLAAVQILTAWNENAAEENSLNTISLIQYANEIITWLQNKSNKGLAHEAGLAASVSLASSEGERYRFSLWMSHANAFYTYLETGRY